MGYTHYWNNRGTITAEQWTHVMDLVTIMLADEECPNIVREFDEARHAALEGGMIQFNGPGSDGHETFYVAPQEQGFRFCKTARKPYDALVTGTLIAMRVVFGESFNIASDGSGREWQAGIDLYNRAASALHDQYKVDGVDSETVEAFINETSPAAEE